MNKGHLNIVCASLLLGASLLLTPQMVSAQGLLWDETKKFQYNIEQITLNKTTPWTVTVVFSVTDPTNGQAAYNIKTSPFWTGAKTNASLRIGVGWSTAEFNNTGSVGEALPNVPRTTPTAPASALLANVLGAGSTAVGNNRFAVTIKLPSQFQTSGSADIGMEGHPSKQTGTDPVTLDPIYSSIPVKSVVRYFAVNDSTVKERRQIVDFNKCRQCHDDGQHGDVVIPRLSLHGANRNEEPKWCVNCHNPNNTDAAYRVTDVHGPEQSIDFKRMVHGIHAGGMRKNALIIIGRNGSINDYSHVRFPRSLRECTACHIDNGTRGTFELYNPPVIGSTIYTNSLLTRDPVTLALTGFVSTNPSDNLRISPIAATCSGCHDDRETREHMISRGASFGATQETLQGREMCVRCHGPGRDKDVRKMHVGGGDD